MRAACTCGSLIGRIETRNGQDCVFCLKCHSFRYNAPKNETGRAIRSASTIRDGIKPKDRARILQRASKRCEVCGRKPDGINVTLTVGHLVSVKDGERLGYKYLNSDENLASMCSECNSGIGEETVPLPLAIAILKDRVDRKQNRRAANKPTRCQTICDEIKPEDMARILFRASGQCEVCGKRPDGTSVTITVGRFLNEKDGEGLSYDELNSDENLISMCSECKSGIGEETIPLRLAIAIIKARVRRNKSAA